MSSGLSREFGLVAACCVWPPSPAGDAAILAAARQTIDWGCLDRIARRQRVEGLVHAGLVRSRATAPAALIEALAGKAREIARRSVAQAAESGRLQALFDGAGLNNLVLKGAAVEILAYGGLGRKSAWDIDLLVQPESVEEACRVLSDVGYELVQPGDLRPAQFETYVALARECEFLHPDTDVTVELHWGLADGPVLLPAMSAESPSQLVEVTNRLRLRTLARDELFAYLCVHGAMHGWSRLKWLADLAALISRESPDAIGQLYARSRALGAGLCSAQALLLCEQLLGATIGSTLSAELRDLAAVRWLVRVALKTMVGGGEKELEARPLASTRILVSQLALGGTWRHAAAQLRYRAVSVHDRVRTPLPKGLSFLYPLLRAPLWLSRRLAWRQ